MFTEKTSIESEFDHNNGKHYLMRMTPYMHREKKQEGVVITFVDVTELKAAEAEIQRLNEQLSQKVETSNRALEHSRQQWGQLVNTLPLIVAVFDPDGKFINVNSQMEHLLQYKSDDLAGKFPIHAQLPGNTAHELSSIVKNTLQSGETKSVLGKIGVDEDKKDLVILSVPLKNSEEHISQVLVLAVDMAEMWEAQSKIKALNENLSIRLKELESINNELEAFNYTISHDLRAPIRAIQSYTSLLQHKYIDEVSSEGVQFVSIIKESAQRMGNLVDDLLSFSRIGKIEVNYEEIDITEMLEESFRSFMVSESEQKHELQIHHPLPKIEADQKLMEQIINNLMSNAIKYSRLEKDPQIDIGAFVQDDRYVFYITGQWSRL